MVKTIELADLNFEVVDESLKAFKLKILLGASDHTLWISKSVYNEAKGVPLWTIKKLPWYDDYLRLKKKKIEAPKSNSDPGSENVNSRSITSTGEGEKTAYEKMFEQIAENITDIMNRTERIEIILDTMYQYLREKMEFKTAEEILEEEKDDGTKAPSITPQD